MCTVTYIPSTAGCFITSNRDESPGRQSTGLVSRHLLEGISIHFPLDELSGGSWIAMDDRARVVCLLNGAFEPFIPRPFYAKSRGQVVIDVISTEDAPACLEHIILEDTAPFTLLLYNEKQLSQLIWDGTQKHFSTLSPDQARIWSSVTLYPPDIRAGREALFNDWLAQEKFSGREAILDFHKMANGDPENDFVMNRNNRVRTLSVTSVKINPDAGSILHLALDKETREEIMVSYGR